MFDLGGLIPFWLDKKGNETKRHDDDNCLMSYLGIQ